MKYVIHLKQGYEWPIGPGVNRVQHIEIADPRELTQGGDCFEIGGNGIRYRIPVHNILAIEIHSAMPTPDPQIPLEPKQKGQ
jgi:hypothetical protein